MAFKLTALTALSGFAGSSAVVSDSFSQWAAAHNKTYASKEEFYARRNVFAANAARVAAHNAEAAQGLHTFTLGLNQHADLTAEEFSSRLLPFQVTTTDLDKQQSPSSSNSLPASVDWSAEGDTTPVYNQGSLGAAWAFAGAEVVESGVAIKSGKLTPLSATQLAECSDQMSWQKYTMTHGLCAAAGYPAPSGKCQDASCTPVARVSAWTAVTPGDETALMEAVAQGTVYVGVEADQPAFMLYTGGVLTVPCGSNVNHALQLVGYGTDKNGGDYWKARNSWGASWGEAGYIRLGRGKKFNPSGQCGIQTYASFPVIAAASDAQ